MMKKAVIIKNDVVGEIFSASHLAELRSLLDVYTDVMNAQQMLANPERLNDAQVMITEWGTPVFDKELLCHCPDLEIVFFGGGAVEPIITDEFIEREIKICSAIEANSVAVAQFTLGQILLSLKRYWHYVGLTKSSRSFPDRKTYEIPGNYDSTVGIVSYGSIGRKVCDLLGKTADVNILVYDPFAELWNFPDIRQCSLEELFEKSDVISVHSPLLDSTVAMIDKSMLSLMKYGSVLINTSRGPVINHCDLIEFLESRKDVYALLDVTDPEPPLPDSPLYSMDNVVISPHIAGCMGRECRRMGALLLGEVRRYVEGRELEYNVELKKLSKN